jgi:hypothetical protein
MTRPLEDRMTTARHDMVADAMKELQRTRDRLAALRIDLAEASTTVGFSRRTASSWTCS